jgi:hypothetical protein
VIHNGTTTPGNIFRSLVEGGGGGLKTQKLPLVFWVQQKRVTPEEKQKEIKELPSQCLCECACCVVERCAHFFVFFLLSTFSHFRNVRSFAVGEKVLSRTNQNGGNEFQ